MRKTCYVHHTLRFWPLAIAIMAVPVAATAQGSAGPSRSFWVSGGIGPAEPYIIGWAGSVWYSQGRAVISASAASSQTLWDDGIHSNALRVGVRGAGVHEFGTADVGIARAYHFRQCDGCGETQFEPAKTALTFSAGWHSEFLDALGTSLTLTAAVGPSRSRVGYAQALLSVELGHF